MTHTEVSQLIKSAFEGVTLSGGISLKQADVIDGYGEGCSEAEFAVLPETELISDWTQLSDDQLEKYAYLPHMDSLGFRYYIPAFILSVLRGAVAGSSTRVSTLHCLYPEHDDLWDHRMMHYAELSGLQKPAIATFLCWVRNNTRLDRERADAECALRNYWSVYLSESEGPNQPPGRGSS